MKNLQKTVGKIKSYFFLTCQKNLENTVKFLRCKTVAHRYAHRRKSMINCYCYDFERNAKLHLVKTRASLAGKKKKENARLHYCVCVDSGEHEKNFFFVVVMITI